MKLKPFKDLIALSKEKVDELMVPIRTRQVRAKVDLEIARIDADLITKETKIQEAYMDKDIDFNKLLNMLDEHALLERRKNQFEKVVSELFPGK